MTINLSHKLESRTSHRARTVRLVTSGALGFAMAAAIVGVSTGSASAAPDNQSTIAHAVVAPGITMTALTSSVTLTGTPGATVQSAAPVTYNVETNNVAGYAVTVQAATNAMLPADTVANADSIPIAALTIREGATGAYTPLSATETVSVHSQDVRSIDTGDNLSTNFQMRMPTVNADRYDVILNYVATTL